MLMEYIESCVYNKNKHQPKVSGLFPSVQSFCLRLEKNYHVLYVINKVVQSLAISYD